MTGRLHVDAYSTTLPFDYDLVYRDDGQPGSLTNPVRHDGPPFPRLSANPDPNARWNGYVEFTVPHADGECDAHRPKQCRWRRQLADGAIPAAGG